jgi:glucosamine kinase
MILVVDSGSTKADWRLIDEGNLIASFYTAGLNPYFVSNDDVKREVLHAIPPTFDRNEISKIMFYGAGCATIERKVIIKQALTSLFPLSEIEVDTDMIGASKALFNKDKGIAVILGTGSNSCLWNGENIEANSPSLGYILGDEGSGAHLGLTLLKKYLNNQLPADLKTLLEDRYPISRDSILENVYRKQNPNRYLAQYTFFIKETVEHSYIRYLVSECFLEFLDKHVKVFDNYSDRKVRCVGSVAHTFNEILQECALAGEIEIDMIIQSPIDRLVQLYL